MLIARRGDAMHASGKKALLVALLLVPLVSVTVAYAQQANWFNTVKFTGTIQKGETTVIDADVDLGTLASASYFEATGHASIQVVEDSGAKITSFMLKVPYNPEVYYSDYLEGRFWQLYVNVTVEGHETITIPIVVDGTFASGQWSSVGIYENNGYWYLAYTGWSTVDLPKGATTITITLFGTTNVVSGDTSVYVGFAIELSL